MTDPKPRTEAGLAARPGAAGDGPDWTVQLAGTIEAVVGTARDKTVVPVRKIVRLVTRALLAALLLGAAATLAAIGFFRFFDVYLPGEAWVAHLALGGVFVLAGAFCFGRR